MRVTTFFNLDKIFKPSKICHNDTNFRKFYKKVMKKMFLGLLASSALIFAGAGCSASVGSTTPAPAAGKAAPAVAAPAAPAPAAAVTSDAISAIRAKLTAAGLTFTEKSLMSDVAKMQTKDSIADGMKFSFSDGQGSTRLVVVTANDASKSAEIKAEMEKQYATIQSIDQKIRFVWLTVDATHVVTAYYKLGDEDTAGKLVGALGGTMPTAAAAPQPTAAIQVPAAAFAVGDKVVANWKNGGTWWSAKITSLNADKINVKYDSDNSADSLVPTAVAHVPTKPAVVKVGDKVVAKWNSGGFYSGTVSAVGAGKATIVWSDGTKSDTALTDIGFGGM